MTCYYNDEKSTSEVLKDGWLYTGDMAMQDEQGFYYLVDRKKDVIVSGGENIYPVQIEDFLRRHDKIKDVAVIGLSDRRLGEKTAAIIEIKDGMVCSKEEIEEFSMHFRDISVLKRLFLLIYQEMQQERLKNQSFVRFTVPTILLQKKIRYKNIQVI